jgi:hypothetical protein
VVEDLVAGAHARLRGGTVMEEKNMGCIFRSIWSAKKDTVKYVYAIM